MAFASFQEFLAHALSIVDEAERMGAPLRLMGGAAIRAHCKQFEYLYERLGRAPRHDMDFITYSKYRSIAKEIFSKFGYSPLKSLALLGPTGRNRMIFTDPEGNRAVDLFFDRLEMCHVIDFSDRLEVDRPSVPLAELLLQKMQIVEINEKDVQDTIILLREHSVGDGDMELVNGRRIAEILSDDWGFYYTVTRNLQKVKAFLGDYHSITAGDQEEVAEEIDKLLGMIDEEPKTLRWKLRAKIGTNKRWYNVVEELKA